MTVYNPIISVSQRVGMFYLQSYQSIGMNDKLLMIAVAAVALVAGLLIGTTMLQPSDDTWNDEDNGLIRIVSELDEHGGEIHVIDPRNSYYGTSYLIEAGDSTKSTVT